MFLQPLYRLSGSIPVDNQSCDKKNGRCAQETDNLYIKSRKKWSRIQLIAHVCIQQTLTVSKTLHPAFVYVRIVQEMEDLASQYPAVPDFPPHQNQAVKFLLCLVLFVIFLKNFLCRFLRNKLLVGLIFTNGSPYEV